ncbi:MAG: hypothetical protein KME23_07915 [Goleter apudmare HA4340-LM2]|jgi:SRSO17 transposase|nr:hypothetical protein [Goleter apudmare HA4340-LM2]
MLRKNLNICEILDILNGYQQSSLEERFRLLTHLVIELLREVEALRKAQINESQASGILPKDSHYGNAYQQTAYLTHNSAGPTGGIDKLLALWFGYPEQVPQSRYGSFLTEILMLRRLGLTEEEIKQYIQKAENLEQLT